MRFSLPINKYSWVGTLARWASVLQGKDFLVFDRASQAPKEKYFGSYSELAGGWLARSRFQAGVASLDEENTFSEDQRFEADVTIEGDLDVEGDTTVDGIYSTDDIVVDKNGGGFEAQDGSANKRGELFCSAANGGYLNLYDSAGDVQARIRGYQTSNVQAYFKLGRVGIGTDSPSYPLHVVGDIYSSTDIRAGDDLLADGSIYAGNAGVASDEEIIISYSGNEYVKARTSGGNGGFIDLNDSSAVAQARIRGYQTSSTQAFFKLGGVAIGQETASYALDVSGSIAFSGDCYGTDYDAGASGMYMKVDSGYTHNWKINDVIQWFMDADGLSPFSDGTEDLGQSGKRVDKVYAQSVDADNGYYCYAGTGDTSSGNIFNLEWTGAVVQIWIDAVNAWNSSDSRYKKNIQEMPSIIDAFMKLNPVNFNWKDYGIFKDDGRKHYGLLAQEVYGLFPSATRGDPDEPQVMGLEPLELIALCIKSIQELNFKIEGLRQ